MHRQRVLETSAECQTNLISFFSLLICVFEIEKSLWNRQLDAATKILSHKWHSLEVWHTLFTVSVCWVFDAQSWKQKKSMERKHSGSDILSRMSCVIKIRLTNIQRGKKKNAFSRTSLLLAHISAWNFFVCVQMWCCAPMQQITYIYLSNEENAIWAFMHSLWVFDAVNNTFWFNSFPSSV